jgi:6-phosphogluconolactonase (cycloisomerase 2 family)
MVRRVIGVVAMAVALSALGAAPATGSLLHFLQYAEPVDDHAIGGVEVSPDGKHVYGFDIDGFVYLFDRDQVTGTLTVVDRYIYDPANDGGRSCEYAYGGISPDGRHVYMTCYGAEDRVSPADVEISIFSRDANTGVLTPVGDVKSGQNHLSQSWHMTFSPDGSRVYVAGHGGFVSVFDRDPVTGLLTDVSAIEEAFSNRFAGIAMSPDGLNVYATSESFSFDAFTVTPGGLSLLDVYEEGVGDFSGIDGGVQTAVSPDGKNVYVAASYLGAVGVFGRNATTGALTFLQSDDNAGMGGGSLHEGLAVTPDGRYVLFGDNSNREVRLYRRDASTGMLTLLETNRNLDFGDPYFAVSPDSRNVYVATRGGPYVFALGSEGCPAAPETGCTPSATPHKSSLVVRDDANDGKDVVVAKWKGTVTPGQLGDPLATDEYALCLYDESGPGGSAHRLLSAIVPPGGTCRNRPCWKAIPGGFSYSDALRTNAGMNKVTARTGVGTGTFNAKAGGLAMDRVAPPLAGTVTMQVKVVGGTCFEATFSAPLLNGPGIFRSKSD